MNKTNGHIKNRRVLILIENLSFPMDRRMRQEAGALRDAGYEVTVISPKGELGERATFEIADGVRVYRYPLYWEGKNGFTYLLEYGWALVCTLTLTLWVAVRHGVDIVHAANPPDLLFLVAWPLKLLGKKFVYDQHDLCPELCEAKFGNRGLFYRLILFLEKLSYRSGDLVITTNQSYYEIAEKRGRVCPQKLCIVRSGPDLQRFISMEPQPELKEGFPFLIVYLGVMAKQDGVDRVVRVAHELRYGRSRGDILFVAIGRGECWQELKRLAKELGVDPLIRFPGRIPDANLLAYLSTADICLAPDPPVRMNQLSTMNKVLEYMACKRPIVSFDLIESRRSAGAAAVYVQDDDIKFFADAIEALLADPVRRLALGELGYRRVTNELSWKRSEEALLEAYARLG
jgi:glycosyltransferase involved in cell wall biosynthesis